MKRVVALVALTGLAAFKLCAADESTPRRAGGSPVITLDTAGGDTWRFVHSVTGRISPGACKSVIVESPAGAARALVLGDRFTADVKLRSGQNAVRAKCALRHGTGAVRTSVQVWTVPEEDRPRAWIRTGVLVGGAVWMDAGATERAAGIPAAIASYEWRAGAENPAAIGLGHGKHIEIPTPAVDGDYRVTLRVTDVLGRRDESTTLFRVSGGVAAVVDVENTPADWVDNAVVYGAAPPLFTPVGFTGVARRLDAIAALGANILWLTPVTAAPSGDFGYAVTSHFQVRDTFGSEAQLRSLIDGAHAHGLKVLLDFVTNHLSAEHPYYKDTERRGATSPYYNWFQRDAAGQVAHYFDWARLENLNYDNPDVRAYIVAACLYWVRSFHVDGFRMDAAWAVRERAPEMWPLLRRELKRVDPNVVLLAEASALDPYYRTHGFDAAYDWTRKLGEWAWQGAFPDHASPPDLRELRVALTQSIAAHSGDGRFGVLHFLDNNDTGARFVTQHGIDQTRTAAALLFTLPGLPLIFAGEEVGAAFEPYSGGPPIVWRDAYGLEPLYASLVRLRHEVPVLRSSSLTLLSSDHDETVLAYEREDGAEARAGAQVSSAERAIVVINFGNEAVDLQLRRPCHAEMPISLPPAAACLSSALARDTWRADDLLTHVRFDLPPGASTLHVSSHDALLLRPSPPRDQTSVQ
jgi:cyclomaltodextrinase / maltogenic alpha-amylase / neopullulanase